MLADNLDRIVSKLSRELIRALRDASQKELTALLPGLARQLAAQLPRGKAKPGPKAKPKKKAAAPSAPRKRGAGSLTRQIMKLLEVRREGFRFEEIQRRFKADPGELRDTLATLLSQERIVRNGQARGTRYSLPGGDQENPESFRGELTEFPDTNVPEPTPLIEITEAIVNEVRLLLLDSSGPASIPELLQKVSYTRQQLKAILEQMRADGLVERVGRGPNPRYQLASGSPKATTDGPRVVRRHAEAGARASEEGEAPQAEAAPEAGPPEATPEA
ncbi:MAG: hypothetical protein MUF64_25180 [Polyangiaceae bacterium]|nr:hypothetical protein [Polyangiaceae bacterium]